MTLALGKNLTQSVKIFKEGRILLNFCIWRCIYVWCWEPYRRIFAQRNRPKKKTDSDFIKSLPSHPGRKFEIRKKTWQITWHKKIKWKNNNDNDDNNNNNNNNGGRDLFSPGPPDLRNRNDLEFIPKIPTIRHFIDPYSEE